MSHHSCKLGGPIKHDSSTPALFADRRPDWWNSLTATNTRFVAVHTYNASRLLKGEKWWEGRGYPAKAEYLVYCSVKKEADGVRGPDDHIWSTDRTIRHGCAYAVSRICGSSAGGCEGYEWDWLLLETVKLDPIVLPSGVGEGARPPNNKNTHLHTPFKYVQEQLARKDMPQYT